MDLPLAGAGVVEERRLRPEAASLERSAVDRLRPLPGFLPAPETLLRDCRPALATWVSLLPTGGWVRSHSCLLPRAPRFG